MFRPPAALLLDLDGTLVDSEPRHIEAHRRFLGSQGITCSEEELQGNIGRGDGAFYRALTGRLGITVDVLSWTTAKTRVLMELYREEGLPAHPGMFDLVRRARAEGIPCLVVTSSDRALCDLSLVVSGFDDLLPDRICHEDVSQHKPHPAPYLFALRRLGLDAGGVLVIEDSEAGIRSGVAAGCPVLAMAGLVPAASQLAAGARAVIAHGDAVRW
jgi:HAD superfamily hydrolase (TIGR01509 family)